MNKGRPFHDIIANNNKELAFLEYQKVVIDERMNKGVAAMFYVRC